MQETQRSRLAERRAENRARWKEAQATLARSLYYAVGTVRDDDRPDWSLAAPRVHARYMLAAGFCLRLDGWTETTGA